MKEKLYENIVFWPTLKPKKRCLQNFTKYINRIQKYKLLAPAAVLTYDGVHKVVLKLNWTALVPSWILNLFQEADMGLYSTPPHEHKIRIQDRWVFLGAQEEGINAVPLSPISAENLKGFFYVHNKISPIKMALIINIKDEEREISIIFSTFWQHMNGKRNLKNVN